MKIIRIATLLLATVALIETAAADKLCLQSTVAGTCDVLCANQEFVLQYNSSNSGSCIVTNLTTNYFTYTNGVGYGVRQGTATITNGSCSYSNLVVAICCPVS